MRSHRVLAASDQFGKARLWRETGDDSKTIEVKPSIAVGEPETRAALIKQGLGIGWLPPFLCADELAAGTLLECLAEYPIPEAAIFAVTPTSRSKDHRVQVFVSFLREAFEKNAITRT